MQNLDLKDKKYTSSADALVTAAKGDDPEKFKEAFVSFATVIQDNIMQEALGLVAVNDTTILSARGARQLTSEETKYYECLISAMRSSDPRQAINDIDVVMPKTTIDEIFVDLEKEHPLLGAIDFQYGRGVTEWLMNANPDQLATWSPLCAEIVKELTSGFRKMDLSQNKLSAFLPVCKAMLDLGPLWLDRYVRAVLREALALGLEDGIINGRGQTQTIHEPIGMRKNLAGSITQESGYPDKTPVVFNSFNPVDYGALLATLAIGENGRMRPVNRVVMIVNPIDYLKKIMPATTVRTTDGSYNRDVFPFPTTIIQSTRIEQGRAIIGLPERYIMISGTGQGGRIEYSDEYRFLEDERVYLVKFYGHGQPKDNNSFMLLDISNIQPEVLQVEVINAGDFPIA